MFLSLQKLLAGIIFALVLIKLFDVVVDSSFASAMADRNMEATAPAAAKAPATATAAATAKAAPAAEAEKPLGARLAAADAAKGATIAKRCEACHTLNKGGAIRVGPNLYGVVGRPKASFPGFVYSDAVKKLGGSWTYEDLDRFLTKPSAFAPGTKMGFPGLPSGEERADVIAYLRSLSPDAPPLPPAK